MCVVDVCCGDVRCGQYLVCLISIFYIRCGGCLVWWMSMWWMLYNRLLPAWKFQGLYWKWEIVISWRVNAGKSWRLFNFPSYHFYQIIPSKYSPRVKIASQNYSPLPEEGHKLWVFQKASPFQILFQRLKISLRFPFFFNICTSSSGVVWFKVSES